MAQDKTVAEKVKRLKKQLVTKQLVLNVTIV